MNGWTEYIAIPSDYVAEIPEKVSDTQTSTIPISGLAAFFKLEKGTKLLKNKVLVTGTTGGVGIFVLQLAQLMGSVTVAQVRKEKPIELVKQIGADEVIVSQNGENLGDFGPYQLIVDGIGGELLTNAIPHCSAGGSIISYGVSSDMGVKFKPYPDLFSQIGPRKIQGFIIFDPDLQKDVQNGLSRLLSFMLRVNLKCILVKRMTGKILEKWLMTI